MYYSLSSVLSDCSAINPLVRDTAHRVLDGFERKILIEPLEYLEFIAIMDGAHYIMTDSGGVQEEAP
ncbi:MAG: UDP-N-acetylglucosamine 2-epimerase, partial [Oscillospiraceae bacterium]